MAGLVYLPNDGRWATCHSPISPGAMHLWAGRAAGSNGAACVGIGSIPCVQFPQHQQCGYLQLPLPFTEWGFTKVLVIIVSFYLSVFLAFTKSFALFIHVSLQRGARCRLACSGRGKLGTMA